MPTARKLPFKLEPFDKRFVPPKPKNSVEDSVIRALEAKDRAIFTRKRDGHYLSVVIGKRPRLYTRGIVREVTDNFPHIIAELSRMPFPEGGTLHCAELVRAGAVDDREYIASLTSRSPDDAVVLQKLRGKASLMVFNTLIWGGKDVSDTFNVERIGHILQEFNNTEFVRPVEVQMCSFDEAQRRVAAQKWEGLVVYDATGKTDYGLDGNEDSPPRPVGCWKKKPSFEDDFIVYGWVRGTEGKKHENRMGKLLLAQIHPVTGQQIPCGEVGIGFSDAERDRPADNSLYPFVAQVEYERRFAPRKVKKGVVQCALCNPRFVRVRDDKQVGACRLPDVLANSMEAMQ